jgi:hypothetical protein
VCSPQKAALIAQKESHLAEGWLEEALCAQTQAMPKAFATRQKVAHCLGFPFPSTSRAATALPATSLVATLVSQSIAGKACILKPLCRFIEYQKFALLSSMQKVLAFTLASTSISSQATHLVRRKLHQLRKVSFIGHHRWPQAKPAQNNFDIIPKNVVY